MKRAIYPGSFDPPTNGHLDIISRASKLFDTLIVGVLHNPSKNLLFKTEEKVDMLNYLTKDLKNVEVISFTGLLVDFCKNNNSKIVIRGLRAVTDFEYEFQMALTNKKILDSIETIFLPTSTENVWLSSSVVKEVAQFGGDYGFMVPSFVKLKLDEKIKNIK